MIPAFQDKIITIIGDNEKALKIIQGIIKSINDEIYIAEDGKKIIGAIIVTTDKMKFSFQTIKTCFKELGISKSIKAFNLVNNYTRSVPKKLENEGTLEAVAVLEEYRGKRIGEDLILKAEEYLKGKKFKYFGLGVKTDNKAIELYEKMNFIKISNYKNKLGNWIYMRKEL